MTTIAILIAVALSVLLIWLVNGVRRITSVSTGAVIPDRPGTALLLIDLQTVFWDDGPYSSTDKAAVERAVLAEVAQAKSNNWPIIALRQEWSLPATRVIARLLMKGQAIVGTPGTEIAKPFAALADETVVKRLQDGFETGALDPLLDRLNIATLRIAGLDFNHCIARTASAARNRGYRVIIVQDATLAAADTAKTRIALTTQGITFEQAQTDTAS
jgi:nicotinamidase-related amidase